MWMIHGRIQCGLFSGFYEVANRGGFVRSLKIQLGKPEFLC